MCRQSRQLRTMVMQLMTLGDSPYSSRDPRAQQPGHHDADRRPHYDSFQEENGASDFPKRCGRASDELVLTLHVSAQTLENTRRVSINIHYPRVTTMVRSGPIRGHHQDDVAFITFHVRNTLLQFTSFLEPKPGRYSRLRQTHTPSLLQSSTHFLTVVSSSSPFVDIGPHNAMKTHMLAPWVLALILSVAFLGHTLARPAETSYDAEVVLVCTHPNAEPFGHADGCPKDGILKESQATTKYRCPVKRWSIKQCNNEETFDVIRYRCTKCNQQVQEPGAFHQIHL
ncbi:hypothetical protein PCASD_20122 [Puccinia coronata f. sp. avenae]|uniref:Uncharacterized protein n=1 Tax=Puccinia coronata f. sp. avenae TaxID=200324 RepID=A0A2N5T0F2_9BASI|nr:hypothetical protein PCASD_20122 [Puccinia coronata f. sp. avenae]